ncbi:zinc fingers and homeoboxes protein 3 isoform X1 [Syngnathus acus]|uniref:zinc fingers and homeoboxes protein 3 isoform X1 n=1 Tax=Syngnathus acus TaxID=161584 RepID=UPI001885E2DF|nr:zinc fingers and homeoboxes protein 3 isoform X1 [Syngnathus acus]XP_037107608.1 zinc fingers and homeoboxes protein 3 isoform X1 [Syngnathus acus]XP_037107610.1 zinc fingers and homeoboxes protein 3 isoform X1 [Syngnathus acus]
MASKRKSTVPCMIPSKSKHVREEIFLGSLPELLPTIPEDGILSISGEESGHVSHKSSKSGCSSEVQKGGTYACPPCSFESRDLNYFLDHMHNYHLDFRAQPTFYCLNCAVSVVRFEALALHNANTHPKIMEGSTTASLSVNKRDGLTTVEQSLFTDNGDHYRESGISLSKTPIAKMMRAKGEHKKIVVSHTVEVLKKASGTDAEPSMLTNVPELQNGALSLSGAQAMPRTAVGHVTATTVSNQVFHQHIPSLYSPPCSDSNKDLPKVMIPLSSIPTYDAAMDTSSFLKTSFGKFPYPTKAELCYLTVVSEFPEEQIKLWFTAQRLKQGISWSPEEIEEARRKMFNTVFQGRAPQKQAATQRHVNHIVTHHTVMAPSGSRGPNFTMAEVPYGGVRARPIGAIAKQASMSSNPQVTRLSYSTPLLAQKVPSLVRTMPMPTRNIQQAGEPEKSGHGAEAACRSSSSSSTCSSSSSSMAGYSSGAPSAENASWKNGNNSGPADGIPSFAACSSKVSNNDLHYVATTPNDKTRKSLVTPPEGFNSHGAVENTSNTNHNNHNSAAAMGPQEQADTSRKDEQRRINQSSDSSISNEQPATKDGAPHLNHASTSTTQSTTSTAVITQSSSAATDDGRRSRELSIKGMSILQQLIKDDDHFTGNRSRSEQKIEPIKINFKRLKMNESESASETAHQEHRSEIAEGFFSPPWANKSAQQLRILRQAFSSARWPNSQQYEELSVRTGLPKSEVVRWFSDSRYSHKNGQLKWLESYLQPAVDAEEAGGRGDLQATLQMKQQTAAKQKHLAVNKALQGEGEINTDQRLRWQDFNSPLHALMAAEGSGELIRAETSAQPGVLKDAWPERDRRQQQQQQHQQQLTATQPIIEQPNDANQTRDRLRMELLEV